MKRILLTVVLLSFGIAYAQQNDFFNAEKYLQKKSLKEKSIIVNPLLKYLKPGCGNTSQCLLTNLPNGNKLEILRQDNMPCIIPDISQFNMPVIKPPTTGYGMPNPASPPMTEKSVI